LSWEDAPPDASWQNTLSDIDLGDYDCAELPVEMPQARGLWLLVWRWSEVAHPEATEDDPITTAKYSTTCEWRRPTLADLVALGVLPVGGDDET